jgi:hypothetical protein
MRIQARARLFLLTFATNLDANAATDIYRQRHRMNGALDVD